LFFEFELSKILYFGMEGVLYTVGSTYCKLTIALAGFQVHLMVKVLCSKKGGRTTKGPPRGEGYLCSWKCEMTSIFYVPTINLFGWLVADGWCWFILREKYCWLVAAGWWLISQANRAYIYFTCQVYSSITSNVWYLMCNLVLKLWYLMCII
jgi:hypothetical protein